MKFMINTKVHHVFQCFLRTDVYKGIQQTHTVIPHKINVILSHYIWTNGPSQSTKKHLLTSKIQIQKLTNKHIGCWAYFLITLLQG